MAIDFENALAKVSTIADTSEVSLSDLEKSILELSDETGIAATDIAENVYNAISAGQSTGDAVAFVENATMLARAGFTDSASALDILTTAMNAYGLESSEVSRVSDVLIQTQNLGKTTVGELASAMGRVIPTAKANGVGIENLASMYAVMTSNGIATAETTTYLGAMLNELGKQGTTAADAFAAGTAHIKEGGLTMAEAMEQGWELTDVLSILDEQAVESGTSIANMFGSAEAGKAAAVLWDNADKLNDVVGQMGNSAGSTQAAFDKLDTTSFSMQQTLNKLKNTGITLGTTFIQMLAPVLETVSEKVQQFSNWVNSLDESQKKTLVTIVGVVAAAAPVLLFIGKIVSGVGSLLTVGSSLLTFIGGLTPVVLVVIAVITALVAVGVWLYNNWDMVKEKAVELATNLAAKWEEIKTNVSEKVNSIKESITSKFEEAKSTALSTFDSIKSGISEKIESARETVRNAIDRIRGFMNFEWHLPHLPMPHFSISGGFSLNPPSVPHFGIEWYKNGGIMNDPTLFGFNPFTGKAMVGGEAGAEAIAPIDTLKKYVSEAVASAFAAILSQSSTAKTAQLIEISVPVELDGAVLAKKLYKYNLAEAVNHGTSLIMT